MVNIREVLCIFAVQGIATLCGTRHTLTAFVQFAVSLIEALYDSHTNGSAVMAVGWVPIESESLLVLQNCVCALTSGIL